MLDTDTKRRIDTARDILVGKVPDPKSQVEQITIALIYKFMDDMDAESEELGGVRSFFAGEFERYGWAKLMAPGIGGHEMLNLYAEAITRMPENPGIPALFRDIFKNAYLPYRDPETLKAFLKVIDEFSYDHSERLGDAFEYLLSVLGSQGAAGQFRTPRHIIDFMVAIVDPRKDERILDPACGTAGFLISAFKHIMATNGRDGKPGAALSPDERKRLMGNIHGYDISPDMVRLSLVNLYLHGFNDPHIEEYATLTSDDHWNNYYNVILANPPFMSPKGGIRPHKRFSVQSNRSEVLFVDYIAEHLLPNGRAAVIVPEGVIFQSGTAYVKLRQLLLNEHLSAVISLPSGVFQPYTGVKTSILIFDRHVAKSKPDVLFSDIKHIGMSLGVKRTPTEQNDLPQVLKDYKAFLADESVDSDVSFTVSRDEIAESGYLFDLKRFRKNDNGPDHIKFIPLGEVCRIEKGKSSSTKTPPGHYPLILTAKSFGSAEHYDFDEEAVCVPLISSRGHGQATLNRIFYFNGQFALANLLCALFAKDSDNPNMRFLYYVLDAAKDQMAQLMTGAANVSMKTSDLERFQIPLPPLSEQEAIVAEVESYQRIIDGARQVVENWRPRIEVDPDWPVVRLGEVCRVRGGKRLPKGKPFSEEPTAHPYIRVSDFKDYSVELSSLKYISDKIHAEISQYTISTGDVYISIAGTIGIMGTIPPVLDGANLTENAAKLVLNVSILNDQYLAYIGMSEFFQSQVRRLTHAVGVPKLALERIKTIEIPLPEFTTQQSLVDEIDCERALIQSNRTLITRYEQKIKDRIARVWGN